MFNYLIRREIVRYDANKLQHSTLVLHEAPIHGDDVHMYARNHKVPVKFEKSWNQFTEEDLDELREWAEDLVKENAKEAKKKVEHPDIIYKGVANTHRTVIDVDKTLDQLYIEQERKGEYSKRGILKLCVDSHKDSIGLPRALWNVTEGEAYQQSVAYRLKKASMFTPYELIEEPVFKEANPLSNSVNV